MQRCLTSRRPSMPHFERATQPLLGGLGDSLHANIVDEMFVLGREEGLQSLAIIRGNPLSSFSAYPGVR